MIPTSPTVPRRTPQLNSPTTPPSTSISSRRRHTPDLSAYRVLVPVVYPRDVDLPDPLLTHEIVDEVELKGFKCFAVQAWLCSRESIVPLFLEWTGKEDDMAKVYVLQPIKPYSSVAEAEDEQRRIAFILSHEGQSRARETPYGKAYAVSVSSFPVGLSPMHVAGGDFRESRDSFYATINLLRMGLTGRAQVEPGPINDQIRGNFIRKYLLPETHPESISASIIFLIQLVQAALAHFGFHTIEIDGLLCDETLDGLWQFENLFPERGIQSYTTLETEMVARLLSTVWATRMRLAELGFEKPPKDPFYDLKDFQTALQAFEEDNSIPLSPFLDIPLLEHIHAVYDAAVNSDPKPLKKVFSKVSSLTTRINKRLHPHSLPMSDGEEGKRKGEEVEASRIEDFVRNVKLYAKRDRMDSLRYLWLGEGTKPEALWEDVGFDADGRRSSGSVKGGRTKRVFRRVLWRGKKHVPDFEHSDPEPRHTFEAVPTVMISGGETSADEFSGPSPLPSLSPYLHGYHSTPSSADHLHLQPSNSTHALARASDISLQTEWGSLPSESGISMMGTNVRTRRRGLKRAWSFESWFDDVGYHRVEPKVSKWKVKGKLKEEELMDEAVWLKSLKRSHTYDFAAEYKDMVVISRELLKIDMALYEALFDLRLREKHLKKMAERYESLTISQAFPRSSLITARSSRSARLASLQTQLSALPMTEPYRTLMEPKSSHPHSFAALESNRMIARSVIQGGGSLPLDTKGWEALVKRKTGMVFDENGSVVVEKPVGVERTVAEVCGSGKGGWGWWGWRGRG